MIEPNKQPQEALSTDTSGAWLDIIDIFHTIQGEGPYTGVPAVFIRLAGCNLRCPMCDTDYTTKRNIQSLRSILEFVEFELRRHPRTKLIVITGGEPLRQKISPLITALNQVANIRVQIESNGIYPPDAALIEMISLGWVTYVVSPKTKAISSIAARYASAFKYILSATSIDSSDGLPKEALGHPAAPNVARPPRDFKGCIYVNPADQHDSDVNARNLEACVQAALAHGYTVGYQLHKLIGQP